MYISHLTKEQEAEIPNYIEKWQSKCSLTDPVERVDFERGIRNIHQEIGITVPNHFVYYASPAAMWREFEDWETYITCVLTEYWKYQIPLCDPASRHRRWRPGNTRPAFNFAAKRYSPGPARALCETEDSDEESGTVIDKVFHQQLHGRFLFPVQFDWRLIGYYACGQYEPPDDYFWERADKEDPTNQIHYQECCFLAPQQWLLQEIACVDFCHSVLGVERNEKLYAGLEAIVESGSFCGVFGRLCVACERPFKVEGNRNNFRLHFRDGEVFAYRDELQE